MELDLMNVFIAGVFAGGLILGFGYLLGTLAKGDVFQRVPEEQEYDPDNPPVDDIYFQEQWDSDVDGFPQDEILEELEHLGRHS